MREKNMDKKRIYEEAVLVRGVTKKYRATFIMNDYIDIAMAVGADGVHLGQEDMPIEEARKLLGKKIIGISTHSVTQAARAEKAGADYIGFGPLFQTATKDAGRPKGLAGLRKIRKNIRIPVVAIGGITWENITEVLDSGADACAIASGILSGDIEKNIKKCYEVIA